MFVQHLDRTRYSLLAAVSHDEAKMRERRERPLLAGKHAIVKPGFLKAENG